MQKQVKFEMEELIPEWLSEYPEDKFTVYKACFLSTARNTHNLDISEEVLRRDAQSILGNFLVAKMMYGDASTHLPGEQIFGYFPKEQEIEFEENDDIVKAWAYCVISKFYAKEFNDIFSVDNFRNTSVEMKVSLPEGQDEGEVIDFDIFGLTCLGKTTNGSCPDANMSMVRFSEDEASIFFNKIHNNHLTDLEQFVKERKIAMAENKSYKVDKSKEAVSTRDWGEVDKAVLRNKVMEASNRAKLVKDIYMLVLDGWEEAPSEKLKYPVMEFKGDTLVYNTGGLASALGYAKKENETSVITKVERIRKKLGLDDNTEGKEETAKMSKEIEFAAVDIGDMWGKVYSAIRSHDAWRYGIEGIYEEDNKKFAVLKDESGTLYRLDFSLTEEGMTVADKLVEVQKEFIETDKVVRFAEPENVEDYRKFADDDEIEGRKAWAKVIKKVQDHEGDGAYVDSIEDDHIIYTKDDVRYRVNAKIKTDADDKSVDAEIDWDSVKKDKVQKMSADEMEAEMSRLKKDIEDRDNIIMEKDTELAELRAFKKGVEDKEKAMSVESVLSEVKDCLSSEQVKEFREEGLACNMSELDGWTNKVKAVSFEATKGKTVNKNTDIWTFGAPVEFKKNKGLWD